eukprot:TRINITY_DN18758_c0_g1_i1.p1 TRINITY_DN18758_c0_g1~~TRINITY_DN18758_c0_g1_i1.p1  ORF type:complete len:672 (-),score=111.72 TRINITY_DN18758_c0_g1_i1:86-2101(-)
MAQSSTSSLLRSQIQEVRGSLLVTERQAEQLKDQLQKLHDMFAKNLVRPSAARVPCNGDSMPEPPTLAALLGATGVQCRMPALLVPTCRSALRETSSAISSLVRHYTGAEGDRWRQVPQHRARPLLQQIPLQPVEPMCQQSHNMPAGHARHQHDSQQMSSDSLRWQASAPEESRLAADAPMQAFTSACEAAAAAASAASAAALMAAGREQAGGALSSRSPAPERASQGTCLTKMPPKLPPALDQYFEVASGFLGEGSVAVVMRVQSRQNGQQLALKVMEKHPLVIRSMAQQVHREVKLQSAMKHPNVLRLFDFLEDDTHIFMLLELADSGSLVELLLRHPGRRLREAPCGWLFGQIVEGVSYIHGKGCIHRDLKPDNILLGAGNCPKLCDFGWCADLAEEGPRLTLCGTLAYMAPEVLLNEGHGLPVDLWALGVLLYELLSGHTPFCVGNGSPDVFKHNVEKAEYPFPPWFTNEVCHLVHVLLQRQPSHRWPTQQVLGHAWLERHFSLVKRSGTVPSLEPAEGAVLQPESSAGSQAALAGVLPAPGCPAAPGMSVSHRTHSQQLQQPAAAPRVSTTLLGHPPPVVGNHRSSYNSTAHYGAAQYGSPGSPLHSSGRKVMGLPPPQLAPAGPPHSPRQVGLLGVAPGNMQPPCGASLRDPTPAALRPAPGPQQ